MSKTFMYTLLVIAVYVVIIFPKLGSTNKEFNKKEETESNKADTKSGTGLSENADKNGVSQGASGQQKYRIGYTN